MRKENIMDYLDNQKIEQIEALATASLDALDNEMQRPFASAYEAWARIRHQLEQIEKETKAVKKLHEELWDAVKENNEDEQIVELRQLGIASKTMLTIWGTLGAAAEKAAREIG